MRLLLATLILAALCTGPMHASGQDPAQASWEAGDHTRARVLYAARLAADSNDTLALHRLALLLAWNREYEESIRLFDQLLQRSSDTQARLDRANVLAWSGNYRRALEGIEELLAVEPNLHAALHARARFLSWAGRLRAADAAYRDLLARDAIDAEALRGLARVSSWHGDLASGERLWRQVVGEDPANVDARIGLSQVLRWRGQPRAALAHAEAALQLDPGNRDAQLQLAWARASFAPRLAPVLTAEFDSEDNQLLTAGMVASMHPWPRAGLTLQASVRRAEDGRAGAARTESRSATIGLRLEAGEGWYIGGNAGVHRGMSGRQLTNMMWAMNVSSPSWRTVMVSVAANRSVLDATAVLMERSIVVDEASANVALQLGSRMRLDAGTSLARYRGQGTNDRVLGRAGAEVRIAPWLRVRPRATGFRFERQAAEGYFDPDRYLLAEVGVGVDRYWNAWSLMAEVAPGVQRVHRAGDAEGALSSRMRVGYTIAPGREIGASATLSNLGIDRLDASATGYRYQAAVLSAVWRF